LCIGRLTTPLFLSKKKKKKEKKKKRRERPRLQTGPMIETRTRHGCIVVLFFTLIRFIRNRERERERERERGMGMLWAQIGLELGWSSRPNGPTYTDHAHILGPINN
jgi:hypothetical protein